MVRVTPSALLGLVAYVIAVVPEHRYVGHASNFLALDMHDAGVKHGLLDAIDNHFGKGATAHRLLVLENDLRPMYQSLPKDDRGTLDYSAVRYALHRLFLKEHGWLVHGLEANGGSWNASSPTDILKNRVPDYVYEVFEEHLQEHGFGLSELAMLAAALERLVRVEALQRMETMYDVMGLTTSAHMTENQLTQIIDKDFIVYLFETNLSNAANWVRKAEKHMHRIYPGWEDTQLWLRDMRLNRAFSKQHRQNPFTPELIDFNAVMDISEEIHDKYGKFQDTECNQLKNVLLVHEYKNSGRMRLSDFYGLARAGDSRFTERAEYLRQLGALDETDPDKPSVVISNYLYGKSMCLAASSYYSVCCIDECNVLLGHLENTFAAPAVEPTRLAAAIANLPSSTIGAPRNLSALLLRRLNDIASTHGGQVPLHGRLFAQFLHHTYPRECPFPHVSGTISPMTSDEFRATAGVTSSITDEEAMVLGSELSNMTVNDEFDDEEFAEWEEPVPWTVDEELVTDWKPAVRGHSSSWIRHLAMLGAVGAMMIRLAQMLQSAKTGVAGDSDKHFV